MRADIYLLEADHKGQPIVISLVINASFGNMKELKEIAERAQSERWVFRPGILFACVEGRVHNLS
jgi:hypothetical protein